MKRFACLALLVSCGGGAPPATPSPAPSAPADAPSAAVPDLDAAASAASAAAPPDATPPPAASTSSTSTPTAPSDVDAGPGFDMSVVFGVYKDHKDALSKACWDHSKSTEKAYIGKASIRLGPTGKVVSTKTEGTDDAASACVDKQIKKWKFPPPNGTATIVLPVHLHRD